MFDSILFPAIALIALSLSIGLIHFISSSMLIGKGKEWGEDVPLEPYEQSPTWLRLQKNNLQNLFLLAAIISLFLEVFPFKSSGSIFTTNNATYLILMSSIVLSYQKLLKEKNFG